MNLERSQNSMLKIKEILSEGIVAFDEFLRYSNQ